MKTSAFFAKQDGPVLTDIWAVLLVGEDGQESVVRRNTPFGSQPLTTSDSELAHGPLLAIAADQFPGQKLRVVRFTRAVK